MSKLPFAYISETVYTESRGMERQLGGDPVAQTRTAQLLIGMHRLISERTHPLGGQAKEIALQGIGYALAYLARELPEWFDEEALQTWQENGADPDLYYDGRNWRRDEVAVEMAQKILEQTIGDITGVE